jgi:uncharacterized protein (DUF58 family)
MKELITKRGYTILSSLFFFIAISVISGELIFVTISMFLFSIFLVELFIFLFSSTELEKIEVVRKITKNRLFVGENLSIKTTLENNGLRTLGLLKILNKIPNELEEINETNDYILNLSPETKVELVSEVKAIQMGKINLGIISLGLFDKFGLFYKKREIQNDDFVSVLPNIRTARGLIDSHIQLGSLPISTKPDPLGSDFSGIREYAAGDDYRKIAWKYMAKSPNQIPKIKQFDLDKKIDVNLIILNNKYMNDGEIGKRKLDAVVQSTITISSVVNNAGGKFNVIFSERNKPVSISGSTYELCNRLHQIKADESLNTETLINFSLTREHGPSIFLFITDSPFPENIDIEKFTRRTNQDSIISIFILDTNSFITENNEKDEVREAREILLENERKHLQKQLRYSQTKNLNIELCQKDNIVRRILDKFTQVQVLMA